MAIKSTAHFKLRFDLKREREAMGSSGAYWLEKTGDQEKTDRDRVNAFGFEMG